MPDTLDPVLPRKTQEQAHRVLQKACDREIYLTTAESCTGGLLAALLTDIPGCSHVFERGFVSYSNKAKCDLLGLDRARLEKCGAVSRETALDMAHGALNRSEAQLALSITGYAGPPGKDEDGEEGLVHFACARKDGTMTHREEHFGAIGRHGVRIAALDTALAMIEDALDQ